MRKMKFISLFVLLWVLLINSTVNATIITAENLGSYDYIVGSGTIEVVGTTSAPRTVSDLSLKMDWPASNDDSGIQITDLGNLTISNIDGFSYWVNAPEYYCPHLTMFLNNSGDNITVRIGKDNTGYGDEWFNIDNSGTNLMFSISGVTGVKRWSWATFQSNYGNAVIEKILISHQGYSIEDGSKTAYLDDFSFGNTDYVFNYIPEPATVAFLGLGCLFLIPKNRRRKSFLKKKWMVMLAVVGLFSVMPNTASATLLDFSFTDDYLISNWKPTGSFTLPGETFGILFYAPVGFDFTVEKMNTNVSDWMVFHNSKIPLFFWIPRHRRYPLCYRKFYCA